MNATSNSSTGQAGVAPYLPEPEASIILRIIIYSILFVLAVIGNIAVCLVPIKQKRMRNFTYFLITNLAVSDIGSMLCLPPLLAEELLNQWLVGETMCKLVNPSLTMFSLITTNSLVAIAVDRFMALVFPFKGRPGVKESVFVISLTWLVAFVCVLPSFGARQLHVGEYDGIVYVQCIEVLPGDSLEEVSLYTEIYNVSLYLINNTLPIVIITAVYAVIIVKLRGISFSKIFKRKGSKESTANDFARPNSLTSDEYYKKQKNEREKKFTKMLLSVVVVFVLFYVPVQTLFLLLSLQLAEGMNLWVGRLILYRYLYLMMWIPNAINPILYGSMNEQYKKAFKRIFRCKGPGKDIGSTTRGSYSRAPMTMQSRADGNNYTTSTNKDDDVTAM